MQDGGQKSNMAAKMHKIVLFIGKFVDVLNLFSTVQCPRQMNNHKKSSKCTPNPRKSKMAASH